MTQKTTAGLLYYYIMARCGNDGMFGLTLLLGCEISKTLPLR